jgi:hypothetical protein
MATHPLDCFSIPLLHRIEFSCICIESNFWIYGRTRCCDGFPLLALCDIFVIFGAIFECFQSSLVCQILGHFS